MKYPFVYIASLMRTGSTVIQEALTELPHSFIFHEPHLGRNRFDIKERFLKDLKVDVRKLMRPPTLDNFAKQVMPRLKEHTKQIGVKEIENSGWRNYLKYFPDTKFILTGRNPKDIFISIHYWFVRKKSNKWKDGRLLTPEVLFQGLNKDFQMQKVMRYECKAKKIRYEDFCNHPDEVMEIMKNHINSPIPSVGEVGGFLSNNPKRIGEYELHGNEITSSRVCRWKREPDKQLVKRANRFYDLMGEYCDFWGY